jgi:hypothetical protein
MFTLYKTNENVDTTLPELILKAEQLKYKVEINAEMAVRKSNGKINPSNGWCLFPKDGAYGITSWKTLYEYLNRNGLFLAC